MKKLYTLMAGMLMATGMASAQVDANDIAGKYRLVGDMPQFYIEDHGFDPDNIIVLDKTGDKSFAIENFYYDMQDYDGNRVKMNGTLQNQGEWASYPTVQNIQFQWDNTDMYLYNSAAESGDTEWFFFANNSFRLVSKYDADKNVVLSLWPNNRILFNYYTEADDNWNNPALEFVNMGAWQEGKEGSLHLQRLPQYTTVTKRGLVGDYVVNGLDDDYNPVQYNISIALDGTEYVMTGLFGDPHPIRFTWDETDAGIRAESVATYDEEGNCTFMLCSYAPNEKIYISFTEDGNLSFDHSLYYWDGQNAVSLSNATTAELEYNELEKFAGKYVFTGVDPNCTDAYYAPAANYECEITVEGNELHMTGFLGNVDSETTPYYVGTYDKVTNTIKFVCGGSSEGEYVVDPETNIWYYAYDFTLNVGQNEAGHTILYLDGNYNFYAYGTDWLNAYYSSLLFEKDGKMPEPEPEGIEIPAGEGVTTIHFVDSEGIDITEPATVSYKKGGDTIVLSNFLNAGKDLTITVSKPDSEGYYRTAYTYEGGGKDGSYFYLFYDDETAGIEYNAEWIDTFYPSYGWYYADETYDQLCIWYWSYTQGEDGLWCQIIVDFNEDSTAIGKVLTNKSNTSAYYDLQGRRIAAPKGLNIKVENGKAVKFLAK